MKLEELKKLSDRKFIKYIKNMNYNLSDEDSKKYIDYIRKIKSSFLTTSFLSMLASSSMLLTKDVDCWDLDTFEVFNIICLISISTYGLINMVSNSDIKHNINDILISKKLLENLKEEDLNNLIDKYNGKKVENETVIVRYMYDRLKNLDMLDILKSLSINNNVIYNDDENSIHHIKKYKKYN